MRNLIEFEYSPWLIIVCLLIGASYSYLQYTRSTPWSERLNYILAGLRALLVTLIAMLILGPMLRAVRNYYEEPLLILALDSSESIALNLDSLERRNLLDELSDIEKVMNDQGWQVEIVDLEGSIAALDTLAFDNSRTNLTRMIRAQLNEKAGANLGALLVVTDGIFNAGFSPDLITPFTPIYTLGLGDTLPKQDVSIIDVEYNKTVYQDNRYPVSVKIRNEGITSGKASLRIFDAGNLVDRQQLTFSSDVRLVEHEFILEANEPGKHRLTIVLDSIAGESTIVNNRRQVYVDIIDGKQKILLAAEAPSPEMKAFRTALSSNSRFEIEQVIGEEPETLDYDLLVLFNSPTRKSSKVYQSVINSETPKLFFIGLATDIRPYLREEIFGMNRITGQFDQVRAVVNPELTAFNLVNELDPWLSSVPPMTVPFGDISIPANSQIVLNQKVGSIRTDRPIIYLVDQEPKIGVIVGDGFWAWRLDEYRNYGETTRFDELIAKLTQYLAAKPDNRQFKLYPAREDFEVGEEMFFIAETYNQLFEPTYGEPVALNIYSDSSNWDYGFTPLAGSNKLSIDNLPEGLYSYTGNTNIDGKKHTVSGQFAVAQPNIEAADLTADHRLLRSLSDESGGKFYPIADLAGLKKEMASLEATSVIHSQENEIFLFNLSWIFILLMLMATIEWLTRKMLGSY